LSDSETLRREFEALLEPALDRAWAVALRLARGREDAEDLVQEAALLAWRGFGTFQRGTNFRAWFVRIITNAFLSGRRRRRPEDHAVPMEEAPNAFIQRSASEFAAAEGAAGGADLARSVLGRLEAEAVAEAIDSLPEEFRVSAALYFLQDQSYQEIATTLGVPVGTVRSRLHRGRALLQKKLWEHAVDHGLVGGKGTS
jgi:RNA polymerase sigma-70 factor (ECF subfamily)